MALKNAILYIEKWTNSFKEKNKKNLSFSTHKTEPVAHFCTLKNKQCRVLVNEFKDSLNKKNV